MNSVRQRNETRWWLKDNLPHIADAIEHLCERVAAEIEAECYPIWHNTEGALVLVGFVVGTNYDGMRDWIREFLVGESSMFSVEAEAPPLEVRRVQYHAIKYAVPIEHPIAEGFFGETADQMTAAFLAAQPETDHDCP